MSLKFPFAVGATLIAALASAPAFATLVQFDFNVPGVGSGAFAYDDDTMDVAGGLYTSPLTEFSFTYNGWTYELIQATDPLAALVWFLTPGVDLAGIQYMATHHPDTVEFAAGFSPGDMGTFTGNGGEPDGIGPIVLTEADFVRRPAGAPEPGTLACLLLGLGLVVRARRRGASISPAD